jgi:hypothetical protein
MALHSNTVLQLNDSLLEHGKMSLKLVLLTFYDSDQFHELVVLFLLLLKVFFPTLNQKYILKSIRSSFYVR